MNIVNLVAALRNTNSSIKKLALLRKADSKAIELFKLAYNIEVTYGVKFKDYPGTDFNTDKPLEPLVELCNKLAERKLTGDAARDAVNEAAFEYGDLVYNIITKDLKCGVSVTSINHAWPGELPQFKVQLAKEVPLFKVQFPCWAQRKYDGVRLVTRVQGDKITFRTRNGKHVKLKKFEKAFKGCPNGIYDGEIIFKEGKSSDRTTVSGMINSAMHGSMIDESSLMYVLFDYLTLQEMDTLSCSTEYAVRMKYLVDYCPTDCTIATTMKVNDPSEVNELYDQQINNGYEGLILKPLSHLYTFKRSKDWVKMKEILTADLICVGVEEGTGKYQGRIGKLICRGTVQGKKVKVKVGSGLSDADRDEDDSYFKHKTIEVKYNSVINQRDQPGLFSLFLPRFVMVRTDK